MGEGIGEEREWRKLCMAPILDAIVCDRKGIGEKKEQVYGSENNSETIAKLCLRTAKCFKYNSKNDKKLNGTKK